VIGPHLCNFLQFVLVNLWHFSGRPTEVECPQGKIEVIGCFGIFEAESLLYLVTHGDLFFFRRDLQTALGIHDLL